MAVAPCLSANILKEDKLCDFLFAFMDKEIPLKKFTLLR